MSVYLSSSFSILPKKPVTSLCGLDPLTNPKSTPSSIK